MIHWAHVVSSCFFKILQASHRLAPFLPHRKKHNQGENTWNGPVHCHYWTLGSHEPTCFVTGESFLAFIYLRTYLWWMWWSSPHVPWHFGLTMYVKCHRPMLMIAHFYLPRSGACWSMLFDVWDDKYWEFASSQCSFVSWCGLTTSVSSKNWQAVLMCLALRCCCIQWCSTWKRKRLWWGEDSFMWSESPLHSSKISWQLEVADVNHQAFTLLK